ncbi:MAG: hypothetical protein Q9223_001504 [Gallowayella weberi]
MKATGSNGSKGTLCQQAQDLEYKLSGLAKSFAGKIGSWNYFFVTGLYYNFSYILFDWKLGWWEIGAKVFVFQKIYETLLYLLAPFVIPISFATRPLFASYLYLAVIVMYILNALAFNYIHLRSRNQTVAFKAFLYYIPFKWTLGFINVASCYYAVWTYASYFAKRHLKVIEDDKVIEIVLNLEQRERYLAEKEEIEGLNAWMGRIERPVGGGTGG